MRLIDANLLMEEIQKETAKASGQLAVGLLVAQSFITNAPTVEQPSGEWSKWIISEIRCPNCLEYFDPEWHSAEELKKCPCCGADMKGSEEK